MSENIDGCWNCKFMERTGMAQIMRCKKSGQIACEEHICSYFALAVDSVQKENKDD